MAEHEKLKAPAQATVDTAALAVLVRAGTPMVVLDARGEDADRRLPGAVPLAVKSTASEVEQAVGDSGALLVTYCTNLHCPLSAKLFEHLKNLEYENVLDYPDGLAGWLAAGYPVEEG
ncbi:MAG: rhodanese-like domain-containing protein [Candidatus Brocadiia bacterium]